MDTSVLVALFAEDVFTDRATGFLREVSPAVVVSNLGAAEFASALNRLVRVDEMTRHQARRGFAAFDRWRQDLSSRAHATSDDIFEAETYLRRLDLNLRTADAIHLAIARRLAAEFATFDRRMAACARQLGVSLVVL